MKRKYILRTVLFFVIFAILFWPVTYIFGTPPDSRIFQMIGAFYEEPENSVDAVYIGSSITYAFWNPMLAWEEYGLAVSLYSSPAMPIHATEYIIRDARKTQPDAVYIVNVNAVCEDYLTLSPMHNLLAHIPESENKTALIEYLADLLEIEKKDRVEFYQPWIRLRESFLSMFQHGSAKELDNTRGASQISTYLGTHTDMTHFPFSSDLPAAELPAEMLDALNSLMDYCEEEDVRLMFVNVPRTEGTEERFTRVRAAIELVTGRGFEVLDLGAAIEEVGIDPTQDYYNAAHSNIHGSAKTTLAVGRYLVDNYGLGGHRGDPAYASWEDGWEKYQTIILPFVLDFELDEGTRDFSLSAPENLTAVLRDGACVLTWEASEGAVGYAVYKKPDYFAPWTRVGVTAETAFTLDADENSFVTVVPFSGTEDEPAYGHFRYAGVVPVKEEV